MLARVAQPRRSRPVGFAPGVIAVLVMLSAAAPAAAKEPPITVRTALMRSALHCHGTLRNAAKEPILLVTGTGATGEQTYAFGKGAFDALGHPVCDVDFPRDETADI
jgi:hypothetical protein